MEYSLSITPLLVGGVTLFGLWLWYRNQKSKGLPPGPFSWPILGNIPQLALEGKKPVFQIALAWREKYGDVFLMRMGATRIVWLCGLKLGREVLIDRGEDFGYRPKWMTMARETQRGQGLVYNYGEVHTQLNHILAKATVKEGVGDKPLETRYVEEASFCVKELEQIAEAGKPVQLDSLFKTSFVNLMYGVVFGKRLEYGDEKLTRWVTLLKETKFLNKTTFLADMLPCLAFLPFSRTSPELIKRFVAARQFVQESISEHEKTFNPKNPSDVIDLCLEAKKNGADLSDLNICTFALDCFFTDTTGEKFLWMIAFIVGHQDVQNKCRAEINKVIRRDRFVTSDDIPRLPYTYATMYEALRYGGTQLSIPRATIHDTTIAGYRVPKHTLVIAHLASIHLDPKLFKDPLEFHPERFLDEKGQFKNPDFYNPYGFGTRKCTSWEMADRALFLFFANLVQRFEFATPEGHEPIDLRGIQTAPHIPFRPKPFFVDVKKCRK